MPKNQSMAELQDVIVVNTTTKVNVSYGLLVINLVHNGTDRIKI